MCYSASTKEKNNLFMLPRNIPGETLGLKPSNYHSKSTESGYNFRGFTVMVIYARLPYENVCN